MTASQLKTNGWLNVTKPYHKKQNREYYPIYIGVLVGLLIGALTYFSIEEKYYGTFWVMVLIYILYLIIQQLLWNKN